MGRRRGGRGATLAKPGAPLVDRTENYPRTENGAQMGTGGNGVVDQRKRLTPPPKNGRKGRGGRVTRTPVKLYVYLTARLFSELLTLTVNQGRRNSSGCDCAVKLNGLRVDG